MLISHTPPLEVRISMLLLRVILMLLYISRTNVQAGVLYPYGPAEGDSKAYPPKDDECYGPYNHSMAMFGSEFTKLYICTNGVISLDDKDKSYLLKPFPRTNKKVPLISPFWADAALSKNTGHLWMRETNETSLLRNVSLEVQEVSNSLAYNSYKATWMLIATWENVLPFRSSTKKSIQLPNTFQASIVSDGSQYVTIFSYEKINWIAKEATEIPAQVGFDAGDGKNFYSLPISRTPEVINITSESNVGIPGRMIFFLGTSGKASNISVPDQNYTINNNLPVAATTTGGINQSASTPVTHVSQVSTLTPVANLSPTLPSHPPAFNVSSDLPIMTPVATLSSLPNETVTTEARSNLSKVPATNVPTLSNSSPVLPGKSDEEITPILEISDYSNIVLVTVACVVSLLVFCAAFVVCAILIIRQKKKRQRVQDQPRPFFAGLKLII